jgi:PhnB protein
MPLPFKPDGYASVSPYIVASGAQRVIDFLIEAFDGEETRRYDGDDGSIIHAEVRIDDSIVMLSDGSKEYPPTPVIVHVYVPDVDASFRRALAAGATAVDEPKEQQGDPDRRGSVKDPAGNTWAIATMRQGSSANV